MAIGSGLAAQVGMVAESVYGTAVTVTRFLEFNTEGISADVASIQTKGLGTGRFLKTGNHKEYVRFATGPIEFDYKTKGFGLLLKHCLGSYANVVVAGSEYKATITPDTAGLAGLSLTVQVGRPDIGGTVRAFTYAGCKVTEWELKIGQDQQLVLVCNFDAATVVTNVALASASYQTGDEIFVFSEAAVTIAAAAVSLKDFSIKGKNALQTERRFLGNAKKEPLANGEFEVTADLSFEFEDLTRYAAWIAGTEVANLVITFTGPTNIAGGGPPKLTITIPKFMYTGSNPAVGGPDILMNPAPIKALYNGTDPIITLEQRTTDTAA